MLKIRLTRLGAKKAPFYRIVVADSRAPREGRPVDTIGQYDATKPVSYTHLTLPTIYSV